MGRLDRHSWIAIGALTALGLALRLFAAQGALWLDEAWSATTAHDVGTPLGVFLEINHDNNHHLNTLWLQMVGLDAPPMLQRALSILAGTVAIPVAALIAARQGKAAAVVAALLFAVSPLLVTYGAEARGYAPMLLALLSLLLVVERWLDRPDSPVPTRWILLWCGLGTLASLTMLFGIVAVSGYALVVLLRRGMRPLAGLVASGVCLESWLRSVSGAAVRWKGRTYPGGRP